MSVSNGQIANQTIFNNAFMSRLINTSTVGKVALNNTSDPLSGPTISNAQQYINNLIQDNKIFCKTANEVQISWSAPSLSFSDDIEIYLKDVGFKNTILASNSPLSIADGESVYVTLVRTANSNIVPAIASSIPQSVDSYRLATRIGDVLILWDGTLVINGSSVTPGVGGGGGSSIKADLYDPTSTTLPSGVSATIDGVSVVDGDRVLFSALSSGANKIYSVSGVGVSLVWTAVSAYESGELPDDGDAVRIQRGTGFRDHLAVYDGSGFKVNDIVRFFNGTDYWELNSLITSTLTDNTTGNVFTVGYSGSEHIIAFYSVVRGSAAETGQLSIVTDGTSAYVSRGLSNISDVGVEFSADISGSDLRLRYTTSSTGSNATMKYFLMRWSNSAGGPAGPPSYSPSVPSLVAAGSNQQVQYNSSGALAGDTDFTWDSLNNILTIGSIEHVGQQSATLSNNVSSPITFFTFDATLYRYAIIEYSISRNGVYGVGRMMITNDNTNAVVSDDGTYTAPLGVSFTAIVSGGNVELQYTTTNTGFNATTKFLMRRWG